MSTSNLSNRKRHIQAGIVVIALAFAVQLMSIQLLDPDYKMAADNNIITRVVDYPLRGMIFDRNGQLIVSNTPVFDLLIIPKELQIADTAAFCEFFQVDIDYLRARLTEAKNYSRVKPSMFIKSLKKEEFGRIQDRLAGFPGVIASYRNVREYPNNSLANVLGYVKEVDKPFLEADSSRYYRMGDMIGKTGLEAYYEEQLRGRRGVKYVMTNVRGIVKGKFEDGRYDTLPVVGDNLITSLDLDLQRYGEKLMVNKRGAVVAIEPSTGEILAMVSYPSYDPNLLTGEGRSVSRNYLNLVNDPHKPLFNRAIQAPYPPGSTFKTAVALIGLQEGALDTASTILPCSGEPVKCHAHPSPLNVHGSIQHSCNPWYVRAFRKTTHPRRIPNEREDFRQALDLWASYMHRLGLGQRIEVDLPFERAGRIPDVAYYDRAYKFRDWKFSNIYSIGIGQGEVGVQPAQLANLAAIIANRGWYYTPHLVKGIGDEQKPLPKFQVRHETGIKPEFFDYVARAMADVPRAGTARRAYMNDIVVCGKTGTAQNPHGKDHSIFMGFAPLNNPQIAIAVYVENAGFGGTWAAPIASLMMEYYIRKGEVKRTYLEEYVLSGNFMNEGRIQ